MCACTWTIHVITHRVSLFPVRLPLVCCCHSRSSKYKDGQLPTVTAVLLLVPLTIIIHPSLSFTFPPLLYQTRLGLCPLFFGFPFFDDFDAQHSFQELPRHQRANITSSTYLGRHKTIGSACSTSLTTWLQDSLTDLVCCLKKKHCISQSL